MKTKKKKLDDDLLKKALEEENLIRTAFKDKDWAEIKGANSWMIFKVMSEFVEGMEKLAKIGPCVTIFGSARTKPSHTYYKMAFTASSGLSTSTNKSMSSGCIILSVIRTFLIQSTRPFQYFFPTITIGNRPIFFV